MRSFRSCALLIFLSISASAGAQVTADRLLGAASEPRNWMTYSGTYNSQRYSTLSQIDAANVRNLELKWVFQAKSLEAFEATPLVVDGIMYLTQAPNDVVALDAKTGSVFWIYHYPNAPEARPCCGAVNRGLALLGDTLYMGTLDAHLVAIDARDGHPIWRTKVGEAAAGYSITVAPLAIKDKIVLGVAGGEFGIRGFVAAYDAATGKEAWKFYTIPGPGEPGHETWPKDSDAWLHGGAPVWLTGSYDPATNLTFWGVGNPGPDFNPDLRDGDNLYSNSVVALNADTGKLAWHFQFTPEDGYDYDAVQIPVLADVMWNNGPVKLMYWANRNGFFYAIDRTTGEMLLAKPFAKVTWASGVDRFGRPIRNTIPPGAPVSPGPLGATNWWSPSFSPRTGLFYLSVWEDYVATFTPRHQEYKEGQTYTAGSLKTAVPFQRRTPVNTWFEEDGHGAIVALDPRTGERKWSFTTTDVASSGVLSTASNLVFAGTREGLFHAFDAQTGAVLWKTPTLGGPIHQGPMTYEVDGKQYVATAAGNSLYVFGLR